MKQRPRLDQIATDAMIIIAPMLRNGVTPDAKVYGFAKDAVLKAMADTERAVLEEVAEEFSKGGSTRTMSHKQIARWLRHEAKERS